MKVDHCQTYNSVVYLVVTLIVLIDHLLQQQGLSLELLVGVGDVDVGVSIWQLVLRGHGVGLHSHVILFEKIV